MSADMHPQGGPRHAPHLTALVVFAIREAFATIAGPGACRHSPRRRPVWAGGAAMVAALLLTACAGTVPRPPTLPPTRSIQTMTVGPREVVLSTSALHSAGLKTWPDGNIGVLKSGSQYTLFAANGSRVARAVGTLDNPVSSLVEASLQIQEMKDRYDYTAGGPVYRDAGTGILLMLYHAEKWMGGDAARFWSLIGMAKSIDEGRTWRDLGEIISPNVSFGMREHEITGGTFAIVGDYFYVYFRDLVRSGGTITTNNLAVARAAICDVIAAALADKVATWAKYHNSAWDEPGLGGLSSALEPGNPSSNFMSISHNSYSGKYLLAVVVVGHDWDLYVAESADGLTWSHRVRVEDERGESYAPTIVGLGPEPRDSDQEFFVYYAFSAGGVSARWRDTVLARRRITLY